jgi:Holliday junction resolvasome RuvABC ATP-dependent DNA helicase subunit
VTAGADRKLVTAERRDEDAAEVSLRPQRLDEFIGQEQARSNLGVFIAAARGRNEPLDHVLFVGPPGLGKTRFTGSIRQSRKSSIRRWRIFSLI